MPPRLLAAAKRDLQAIVAYYNAEEPGLGNEFWDEVVACLGQIQRNPRAWTDIGSGVRRTITHRFPYGVLFQIRDGKPIVIAVMHLKRHPLAWRSRL